MTVYVFFFFFFFFSLNIQMGCNISGSVRDEKCVFRHECWNQIGS